MTLASQAVHRRLGWLGVVVGAVFVVAVQTAAPVGVPLYDGVVVVEPYRYLHPSGEQAGSPTTFTSTPKVTDDTSPIFVAATSENPAQAQLIAQRDAFRLTPGATALSISITPIEPGLQPPGGTIAGNVYRFSVADQDGTQLAVNTGCTDCLSLVLRAPDANAEATVWRLAGGAWSNVGAEHAGILGSYALRPDGLGDFAIVTTPEPDAGLDPMLIVAGGVLLVLLIGGAVLFFRVPSKPVPAAGPGGGSEGGHRRIPSRVPSKRRAPRRPPGGRSNQ